MKTLCIITCGSKKIWDKKPNSGPTKAKEAYIGSFSRKCKEYAEKYYPNDWCILSAKYGFIFPDEIIKEPYDVCFYQKKSNPITPKELSKQSIEKKLDNYDKITVLGGKIYTSKVKKVFPEKEVYNPLSNCGGIGYMMQKMNKLLRID